MIITINNIDVLVFRVNIQTQSIPKNHDSDIIMTNVETSLKILI